MKEYVGTVQFEVGDSLDFSEILAFERRHGHLIDVTAVGTLSVKLGDSPFDCNIELTRGQDLRVSTSFHEPPDDLREVLEPLRGDLNLSAWTSLVSRIPERARSLRLRVEYAKKNSPESWTYQAFTREGVEAIRQELRRRFRAAETPPTITLLYEELDHIVESPGFVATSSRSTEVHLGSAPLLLPQSVDPEIDAALAKIQVDFVGLVMLGHDLGPNPECSLAAAVELCAWVRDNRTRHLLAARYVAEHPVSLTEAGVRQLTSELALFERDLVSEAVANFERAKSSFREISIELLRSLHSLRAEVLSLMGSELFQMAASIALTIAGLTLSQVVQLSTSLAVSLVVGILFYVGAYAKAFTHEREFRGLIEFNAHFGQLPIAAVMPEFRGWYKTTLTNSVSAFYSVLQTGLTVASVPIAGVLTVWASITRNLPPASSVAIFAGLVFVSYVTTRLVFERKRQASRTMCERLA